MADLAKTRKPIDARRRGTDNRDYALPSRRETDTARTEVNAPLVGPNQSEAQRLAQILGVAQDAGEQAVGLLQDRDARRRDEARTAGGLDFQSGSADEERLAKSRAYAEGYYTAGAQRTVIELSQLARNAVNERLFNEDDPATLEDINETLNQLFSGYALNEDGSPRDFGDPGAARIMANGLSRIRAEVLPQAEEYIRNQQNEKYASNEAFNLVNGGLPEIFDPTAGTPIGTPRLPNAIPAVGTEPSTVAPAAAPTRTPASPGFNALASAVEFVESRGNPNAVSPKGALGRLQVMPDTARDPGYGIRPAKDNSDAELTRVGQEYLQAMLREYGGDPVLALAAYNAGPGRANAWADRLAGGTLANRIARIPIAETRDYVRNVLMRAGVPLDGPGSTALAHTEPGANEDPNLRDKLFQPEAGIEPLKVDFEKVMERRPPSMSPAEWKAYMVPAIITQAEEAGRPEILDGLWRSTRADGTPSFNPKEIGQIRDATERIREDRRIKSERARNERWVANSKLVLTEIINDRDPSDATIIDMVNRGELDPMFGHTLIERRESDREQAAKEAEALDREAAREAEREYDRELSTLLFEREAGILTGASREEDLRRFRNGDFGTGKAAVQRLRQAQAATEAAARRIEESPMGREFADMLDRQFPKPKVGGNRLIDRAGEFNANNRNAALAHYAAQLRAGKTPSEAYESTIKLYGGDNEAAMRKRRDELRSRQ